LFMVLWTSSAQASGVLLSIQEQLRAGNPDAAWSLARQHLDGRAGDPDFDFVAGLSALEAGEPAHAAMILERVLLVQPGHHRARLELARAYFQLGDHAAAQREFQAVRSANPPANVGHRIEIFLAEIERRESATRTRISGYVELRPGWDSNAASATSDSSIEIPAIGVVTLDDSSRERSDRFLDKNAGMSLVHPLDKHRALFFDIHYRDRENIQTQAYDTRSVGLSAGLARTKGADLLRIPLQYQTLYLANEHFRHLLTLGLEWSRDIDPYNQALGFGQAGTIRYPEDTNRDVSLLLAGGGWNHRHKHLPLMLSGSIYLGNESARQTAGDSNGRRHHGVRLGAQWNGIPAHTPYATINWQRSNYDAPNPVFLSTRREDFSELKLGWSWRPQPQWNITAEASLMDNDANIALYEYRRRQFSVGVRYQFD
jgi:tetratricopeptide (TPR) repeat protein